MSALSTTPMKMLLACLLALAVVSPSAQPRADIDGAAIDRFVADEMARQHIPGVAVAIVRGGAVMKARGYGYANVEHEVPVTRETMFQSGSLGKQFTAAAVMLQVEDGKLSLSDPITRFFPDAPAPWKPITVRHLLTHTSGIPDYTTDAFDYRRDYTEEDITKMAYALPLEFPAGSRWNYSNTGYVLLGIIVHKVSGQFYGDVLTSRVFAPLGMKTARVISEADIVAHRAAGYRLEDGALKNQEWVAPTLNTTADGALYLSLDDMIAWDAGIRGRRVLREGSWNEIFTPVRLNSGKTYPYGFGWELTERAGQPVQEHGGAWQGFESYFARFLGDDLSIVVFANSAEADTERICDGVAALVDPALTVPTPHPIEDREPQVTARVKQLVEQARTGRLSPAQFAYVRAGFFPGTAKAYAERLQALGALERVTLLNRIELGDDRAYTYRLEFAGGVTKILRLALAPDDRIAVFSIF